MTSDNGLYNSDDFWEHISGFEESGLIPEVKEIGDGVGQAITSGSYPMLVQIADDGEFLSLQSIVQYQGQSVAKMLSIANSLNNTVTGNRSFFVIEEECAIGMKAALPVELGVTLPTVILFITTFFDAVNMFAQAVDDAFAR